MIRKLSISNREKSVGYNLFFEYEKFLYVDNISYSRLLHLTEKAWQERDAAQTLEQVAQSKMRTMREKLDKLETSAKKTGPRDSDKYKCNNLLKKCAFN